MIPDGFAPHYRKSKFTDPWEPLYSCTDSDQVQIGVILRDVHCNSRGLVHGGFISAIADNAMGLSCGVILKRQKCDIKGLVTVTLSTDFVGSAKIGEWLVTDTTVIKAGGSLCFTNALIRAGDTIVARASATFKNVV
jgi:acyl-coenzyme A thioesterase PaaI-like protein